MTCDPAPASRHRGPVITLGAHDLVPGIVTLTQLQIMTRANALTLLKAAFTTASHIISGAISAPDPHFIVAGGIEEVEQFLRKAIDDAVPVVVDIETQGDIEKLHHSERELLCIALEYDEHTMIVPKDVIDSAGTGLRSLLYETQLVAHNGKFDLAVLEERLPGTGGLRLAHDTMLMHFALNPAATGNHGLKDIARVYFHAPDWDNPTTALELLHTSNQITGERYTEIKASQSNRLDYTNLAATPTEVLHMYNAQDVKQTRRVLELLTAQIEADEDTLRVYRLLMRASAAFQQTEPVGIAVDLEHTRKLSEQLGMEAAEHLSGLVAMAAQCAPDIAWPVRKIPGTPRGEGRYSEFNPASPKQVGQVYAALGKPLKSTAEPVLEDLLTSEVDGSIQLFTEKLLEYRGITKLKSTYTDSVLNRASTLQGRWARPRVYPSYNLNGTVTGRLSSFNPNIQNQPRDKRLRQMYVGGDGDRSLVQVDFAQAELRVMAVMSEDQWLMSIFADPDRDFFDELMPSAFPDAVIEEWSPAEAKEHRAKLKGVVYGLSFGRGAAAIAHALRMPTYQAQEIIDNYLGAARGVARWREQIEYAAVHGHPIKTVFGRYFQQEVVTRFNRHRVINSALAFQPQSTASDICLTSYCEAVESLMEARDRDWYVVAEVHDAITLDVPSEQVEEAAAWLSAIMVDTAKAVFPQLPFGVDAKWGNDWSETS